VLHTSGSTGDPKGVVITRQHVDAFCSHWAERVQLQAGSRVAQVASLTFDLSLFELGATLGSRATLCPVPEAFLAFPSRLVEWLVEERISHWYSVPSLAGSLLDAGLPEQPHALDVLMVAGETLPAATARRMLQDLPATRLLNLFGPTETNVSCAHELAPDFDGDSVPIGRPCPYLQIAILGEDDQAAERGELVARGATVTPGYLDEAQSADWVEHAGQPWLRTGDRVERRDDGLLYFLGRADRMIKRRGFRIEPEELERALRSLDAVHEAAVVPLRAEEPGSARALVAFVEGSAAEPELLEAALRSQLPAEALPDRIVPVESLPRGARGKVDRASLELRAEVLMS